MRVKEFTPSKLVIFDIDDTLVHTQTKVHVVKDGQVTKELNSHDFTHYKLQPGEQFDFANFRNAEEFFTNSKPIIPMMNQLKHDIATGNKVVMVTARADFDDRELFLDTFRKYGVDMNKVHVYRAGNMTQKVQTEEKKKIIIRKLLNQGRYTKAIMYDDAVPNLESFVELKDEYPQTKFYAWHVSLEGVASEYHRTNESQTLEERKKKKRRVRYSAYGPGPYGSYGFDSGYSGDGGVEENFAEVSDQIPQEIYNLLDELTADDTGKEEFGDYVLRFEGFTDWCQQDAAERCNLPDNDPRKLKYYEDVYDEVLRGWIKEQGSRPVDKGFAGNDDYPVQWAIFKKQSVTENFADGRNPQDKGDAKRHGINTKASVSSLRKTAKQGGRKGQLAHWLANMKAGRAKKK